MSKAKRPAKAHHRERIVDRVWQQSVRVCDHLGIILDFVCRDQAQRMHDSGDYIAAGTKKTIDTLVHKGPPDGREVKDEHAMKPKGSQRPVYRHKAYSGRQWWELKNQPRPWTDIRLSPWHETPSTGGPDI